MKFFSEMSRRMSEKRAYRASRKAKKLSYRTEYVISKDTPVNITEAFRSIKATLSVSVPQKEGGKAIVVTSGYPYVGKTTIATNLALMFALSDMKVIIIDADMHRGRVAKFFHEKSENGLSDYLSGQASYESVVRTSPADKNLSYISCGTHSLRPYELLESDVMKDLMARLRKEYDYIIVDTPPVLILSDALAVAPYTDGAIIVVRHEMSYLRDIERELDLLKFAKVNVLGAVINDYKDTRKQKEYGGYSYYYDMAEKGKK